MNEMARIVKAPSILILAAVITACAQNAPRQLEFSLDNASEARLWPPLPDVPRFRYTGTLRGETDFHSVEGEEPGINRFFRWVVGIGSQPQQPELLLRPQTGIVDGGRIYVTDIGKKAVFVFDTAAGRLNLWDSVDSNRGFFAPVGICILTSGVVVVADAELGHLVHLSQQGEPLGFIGDAFLLRPTGVACDGDSIYVADTAAHRIVVFDQQGRFQRNLGRRGMGDGEFNGPTHIAIARGQLYVSDTLNARVQVMSPSGFHIKNIGRRGLYVGNLVRPKGVAIDDEGNVYVVEGYYDRLLIFNAEGEFLLALGKTGSGEGDLFLPTGVWRDQSDRVFVADMFNARIAIFQFLGE
jgi:hypothetical protein